MQTFLTVPDFREAARHLDITRLQKQLVETLQIMNALVRPGYGWQHHPAVKQWRGYEYALLEYQAIFAKEYRDRGWETDLFEKTYAVLDEHRPGYVLDHKCVEPWWLGTEEFHASHRSNLMRKLEEKPNPRVPDDWYLQWLWTEPTTLEYWWPTRHEDRRFERLCDKAGTTPLNQGMVLA